nr:MAG TPA: hypothetical protein [Caudoviricetes sp.]
MLTCVRSNFFVNLVACTLTKIEATAIIYLMIYIQRYKTEQGGYSCHQDKK